MTSTNPEMPPADAPMPEFPTLLNQVDGILVNARIGFALTSIERAMTQADWPRAIELLSTLADRLSTWDVPNEGMREVLGAAAWCGVNAPRLDELPELEAIFERHAARAWPRNPGADPTGAAPANTTPGTVQSLRTPARLAGIFDFAERRGRLRAGLEFARLLTRIFPEDPLGHYAAAHFTERMRKLGHTDLPTGTTAEQIAAQFLHADALIDAARLPGFSRRARLRAGVLLLESGADPRSGRELLRELPARDLTPGDRLAYAVGMAHSPYWLDRVRAADELIALSATETPPPQLHAAIRHLLAHAPLQLEALEVDRLHELLDLLGPGDDATRLRARLALRTRLEQVADQPARHADQAADIFAELTDPAAAAAADFSRASAHILRGDAAPPDADALQRIEAHYPLAACALRVLHAAHTRHAARLATALGELEGKLRLGAPGPRDLKPIGLIWPTLLDFLQQAHDNPDAHDPTAHKRILASTHEILARWLPDAPRPTYGWWALSAHLLQNPALAAPWPEHAARCAERAMRDDRSDDLPLQTQVLDHLLDRAIAHAPQDQLLKWLERARRS